MPLRITNDDENNVSRLIHQQPSIAEELKDSGVDKKPSNKPRKDAFTLTRKSSKHGLSRDDDGSIRGNVSMPNLGYVSHGLKRSKSRELNKMNEPFLASSRSQRRLQRKSQGALLNASFSAIRHVHNSGPLSNQGPRYGGYNETFDVVRSPGTSSGLQALEVLTSSTVSRQGALSHNENPLLHQLHGSVRSVPLSPDSQRMERHNSPMKTSLPSHSTNPQFAPTSPVTNPFLNLLSRPKVSVSSVVDPKENSKDESVSNPSATIPTQVGLNYNNSPCSTSLSQPTTSEEILPAESTEDAVKTTSPSVKKRASLTKITQDFNPQTTLISILQNAGYKADMRSFFSSQLTDFFSVFTEENILGYTPEVVAATRKGDLQALRELHEKGLDLHIANQFGESIVHIACRRGNVELVRFLLEEAKCPLRVKDDFGRTPFHDACWCVNPNFDLMDLLLSHDVDLLLVQDKRGHSPFSYARRNHWKEWTEYLLSRQDKLHLKTFIEPFVPKKEPHLPKVSPVIG